MALEWIDDLRTVKSPAEIALIQEACRWGDRAHALLQQAIVVGVDEVEVSHRASLEATREMLEALGPRYVPKAREGTPAQAMFIRGANTAHPHGLHQGGGVARGDVLVSGAFGVVGGYESELEHPFLDLDDPTPIEPGMVFSLEPGLYLPGVAGFRHSDTVVVTEDGCRNLCEYPRNLDALVVAP